MARTTEFEKVLMERDGLTKQEAESHKRGARESIYEIIEAGGSYDDVEDMLLYDYGLEMDYIMDLI